MSMKGKTAFVSGAASGIGKDTALILASKGANVILADLNISAAQAVEASINADPSNGRAHAVQCDVSKPESLKNAIEACTKVFGSLDIALNSAGIGEKDLFQMFEDGQDSWRMVLRIDLEAVVEATRLQVREMRKGGDNAGDRVIVNIASMAGFLAVPSQPSYAAAKAGVIHFTRSLGYLGDSEGIRVNCICPSYVDTPMVRSFPEDVRAQLIAEVGGMLQPSDITFGIMDLIEDRTKHGAVMRVTFKQKQEYVRVKVLPVAAAKL